MNTRSRTQSKRPNSHPSLMVLVYPIENLSRVVTETKGSWFVMPVSSDWKNSNVTNRPSTKQQEMPTEDPT